MDATTTAPAAICDVNLIVAAIDGSPCTEQFHYTSQRNRNVSCGHRFCDNGNFRNGYGTIDDVEKFLNYTAPAGVPANPAIVALRAILTDARKGKIQLCSSQYMAETTALKLGSFVDVINGETIQRYSNREIAQTLVLLARQRVASGGIGVSSEESEVRVGDVLNALPFHVTTPRAGEREGDVDYEDQRVLAAAFKVREDLEETTPVFLVTADAKLRDAVFNHLGHRNILVFSTSHYASRAHRAA